MKSKLWAKVLSIAIWVGILSAFGIVFKWWVPFALVGAFVVLSIFAVVMGALMEYAWGGEDS